MAEPLSLEFLRMQEELADPDRAEPDMVHFTDEEGYGRFVDIGIFNWIYTLGIYIISIIANFIVISGSLLLLKKQTIFSKLHITLNCVFNNNINPVFWSHIHHCLE